MARGAERVSWCDERQFWASKGRGGVCVSAWVEVVCCCVYFSRRIAFVPDASRDRYRCGFGPRTDLRVEASSITCCISTYGNLAAHGYEQRNCTTLDGLNSQPLTNQRPWTYAAIPVRDGAHYFWEL